MLLIAYGAVPKGLTPNSCRRAIGMATAGAFCLLQVIGRPVDGGKEGDEDHRLSGWPRPSIPRDQQAPDPDSGAALFWWWFALFLALMVVWVFSQVVAVKRSEGPSHTSPMVADRDSPPATDPATPPATDPASPPATDPASPPATDPSSASGRESTTP
jgi:hypothetical protein